MVKLDRNKMLIDLRSKNETRDVRNLIKMINDESVTDQRILDWIEVKGTVETEKYILRG